MQAIKFNITRSYNSKQIFCCNSGRIGQPDFSIRHAEFNARLSAAINNYFGGKIRKRRTTMILGVYFNVGINSYLIDAVIGLSVVYKALDNLGAFQRWLGVQPNTKIATLVFGLFHGLGLATKIIEYEISPDGLVPNLLAFNVGVEIGQLLALALILIGISYWRRTASFIRHAYTANVAMMSAGFILVGMQLTGYFVS